jgi:Tol biopolymer transport system component
MRIDEPSLSPDGRWIVFSRRQGSDTSNLWVVPAGGGVPIQLTSGRHSDGDPRWFQPGSDRRGGHAIRRSRLGWPTCDHQGRG